MTSAPTLNTVNTAPTTSSANGFILRFIIGMMLLLPLCGVLGYIQLIPAINTFDNSTKDVNPLRADRDVSIGMENYDRMSEDPRFDRTVSFTSRLISERVAVMIFIPALIGILLGVQGGIGRNINRVWLGIVAVFASPLALGMIWTIMVNPTLPPNIESPFSRQMIEDSFFLGNPDTAPQSLTYLDSLIWVLIAITIGGSVFMAIMRGRDNKNSSMPLALTGMWFMGIAFAVLSIAQTFILPYSVTNGGPLSSTTSILLYMFEAGFVRFRIGYGSAVGMLILAISVGVSIFIWLLVSLFRIRISYEPAPAKIKSGCLANIFSAPLLALFTFPVLGIMLWGWSVASKQNGFDHTFELFEWKDALYNTFAPAWVAIWVVQVPVTYLGGMALGFFRPLGRIGSAVLFLPFLVIALIPSESLIFDWWISAADNGNLNKLFPTLMFPYLVGGLSLLVFKMFFDGTYDKYRAAVDGGESVGNAFFYKVFFPSIPIAILVGVVLSFMSSQSVLWALISVNDHDLYTLPLNIIFIRQAYALDFPTIMGLVVAYSGILAAIFIPLFILLQVLVVDRLAILAGGNSAAVAITPTTSEEPVIVKSGIFEAPAPSEETIQRTDVGDTLNEEVIAETMPSPPKEPELPTSPPAPTEDDYDIRITPDDHTGHDNWSDDGGDSDATSDK